MLTNTKFVVQNIFEGLRTAKKCVNMKIHFGLYSKGTLKLWNTFRTSLDP
jgi:hypothetical protein